MPKLRSSKYRLAVFLLLEMELVMLYFSRYAVPPRLSCCSYSSRLRDCSALKSYNILCLVLPSFPTPQDLPGLAMASALASWMAPHHLHRVQCCNHVHSAMHCARSQSCHIWPAALVEQTVLPPPQPLPRGGGGGIAGGNTRTAQQDAPL